jgi:hypothetical protein
MVLTEIGWGRVDWIHVAHDSDRWRALVNAIMNFRVKRVKLFLCLTN